MSLSPSRHSRHGWSCGWLDPVENDPVRTPAGTRFVLDAYDLASSRTRCAGENVHLNLKKLIDIADNYWLC